MKLLYIVPNINNEGGVARILSLKTNYFITQCGFEVNILTQNNGNTPLFYSFHEDVVFHDMQLKGAAPLFAFQYYKALNQNISLIKPNCILICDNGLKAFLLPFLVRRKIPLLLEIHSSIHVQEHPSSHAVFNSLKQNLQYHFKKYAAEKYTKVVFLSNESAQEWNVRKKAIIPNPLWFAVNSVAPLSSRKVIAVARNTYEKGLDRLLPIWKEVVTLYPSWKLELYCGNYQDLELIARELGIQDSVVFLDPTDTIQEAYLQAAIYIMTSRYECFPMVLLEAMASGVPCVAYDCPCGPKAIINHGVDGLLVEDGNQDEFIKQLELLMSNETLRLEMGKKAQATSNAYQIENVMPEWQKLIKSLT